MHIIRRGRIGEPKVVPARDCQWTAAARGRFLDHLAATCNVRAACLAAGRHHTGAYALRRRDPEFAAQWQEALEQGYATLEAALLERALRPLRYEPGEDAPNGPPADFDVEAAMKLLAQHRTHQGRGARPAQRGGPRPQRATEAETNAAIMAALDRIDARQAKLRGDAAGRTKS